MVAERSASVKPSSVADLEIARLFEPIQCSISPTWRSQELSFRAVLNQPHPAKGPHRAKGLGTWHCASRAPWTAGYHSLGEVVRLPPARWTGER